MMKAFIVLQKGFHSEIDACQQGGFVQQPEYLDSLIVCIGLFE